jgi:hypothetical protein
LVSGDIRRGWLVRSASIALRAWSLIGQGLLLAAVLPTST